jgi:hypothetical protein
MSHRVKTEERLKTILTLKVPDVNRGKSYKDISRKYRVEVDGKPTFNFDQNTLDTQSIPVRLRSVIQVKKTYGSKKPDAVFTYRVGENFAEIQNQSGAEKRIALDFTEGNILQIEDDYSFNNLVNIK